MFRALLISYLLKKKFKFSLYSEDVINVKVNIIFQINKSKNLNKFS